MKSILISINPKWCEKIASGEKTIEVRKTRPRLETPFKCYIYRTKGTVLHLINNKWTNMSVGGKVIGEFVCDNIVELAPINRAPDNLEDLACLTREQIVEYIKGRGYGWHISDLVIYDKPRELSEFYISDNAAIQSCKHREIVGQPEYKTAHNGWIKGSYICNANGEPDWCTKCKVKPITRPPQSWCYVEEVHNG